jgi:flagella basal body P-ring formation protein FlgA
MTWRGHCAWWFGAVVAAAGSASAHADEVKLTLRVEGWATGAMLTLGDVAEVQADSLLLQRAFEQLSLGRAPLAGQLNRSSRQQLTVLINGYALAHRQQFSWAGADSVTIRTPVQLVDGEVVAEQARQYVLAKFGPRLAQLEVGAIELPAQVAAPAGALQLRVRELGDLPLRPRMAVWVDVLVAGQVYRSVVVPLALQAKQQVLVAQRALAPGTVLTEQDVLPAVQEVSALPAPAMVEFAPGTRLRQALEAGQVLTQRDAIPPGQVVRGERVRLRAGSGGVVVETAAIAQADAFPGQRVAVKPVASEQIIMARVTAPGVVSIEER